MKKKNKDSQKANDLLRKLQEAVLASHKKDDEVEEPDSDDLEFQQKIAGMLSRFTEQPVEKKTKKSASRKAKPLAQEPIVEIPRPTATEAEAEEIPEMEEIREVDEVLETEEILEASEAPEPEEIPTAVEIPPQEMEELSPLQETDEAEEPEKSPVEETPTEMAEIAEVEPLPLPLPEENETIAEQGIEEPTAEASKPAPTESTPSAESITPIKEPVSAAEPLREESKIAEAPPKKTVVRVAPAKPPKAIPVREKEPDRIIITPKSNLKSTVPIVIKPKRDDRTATAIPVVEVKKSMPKAATPAKATSQSTEIQTGVKSGTPKATGKRPPAGVSMPRPQSNAFQSTKSKSIKKRPTPVPKTSPAVDEGFDIVLENVQADGGISPAVAPQFSANAADMGGAPRSARRESFHSMLSPKEILDYTEKKTGLTPDDVSMILEMGYDSELSNLIGRDALKKLKAEHLRATRPVDKLQYATAFGYRNREYTGEESRELILANYVRDKKSVILRLALTAAITVMLLLLELPWFLGEAYGTYRQAAPWLFALLSLGGLVGAGVLSRKALGAGLRNFFRLTPSPYSVAGITFTVAAFVGILNVLLAGSESELISLNLPAAGVLLLTAICDTLRLSSEMRVFGILSAEDEKTVLEPAELHKQKLRHGDKIVKIINDDIDQNLYRLRRSRAISGFFRRCNESGSAARPFGLLLLISLTLSFLSGLLAAICGEGFATVSSTLLLTFFFSLPIPSVLLFFYPLCRANRKLTKRNCALVGEESVVEYSQPKTVIFGDKDLYTVRKCTQTMTRDGDDFRRDLRLAGILFRQMDGALSMLDQNAAEKAYADPHVTFVRLGESGTEAIIDNRHHLLAGNAKFLAKSGVRVPKESSDRTTARSENTALMYVAIDGVLKLTYEIEYEASDSFEAMVALLAEHGTYAAIRTYDPNLNDAFLQQSRAEGAEYVRVIKPSKHESRSPVEISDSGIVALGDQFDVTRALLSASLIQKIRRCGYFIQGAVSLAGAILATVLAFSLEQMLPGIPLMLALLFQGVAVLASWIATRLSFRFGATENFK